MFICALCKAQTVGFEKLAAAFETSSKSNSSLRQIQRFMADYCLDTDLIALLIFKLLPHKPPYRLTLDRTNWKFSSVNINILNLAIVYQGLVPANQTNDMQDKRLIVNAATHRTEKPRDLLALYVASCRRP